MPKLALIESEAMRRLARVPETRWRALQQALVELCDARWPEIRGTEPTTPLAHTLWSVAPPRADLLADLAAAGDSRLHGLLGTNTARGFALLALAEVERGDAEGVRLAHAPMMLFDTPTAGGHYAEAVAASLRGAAPVLHRRAGKPPLWQALACIATQCGRTDLAAVRAAIGVLASSPVRGAAADAQLVTLRRCADEAGVHFLGIEDDHVSLTLHGHAHAPVRMRQLVETLGEIRQAWLA